MTAGRWQDIDLSSTPRMIVARRKSSKRIDANQIELHSDLFDEIRSICTTTLQELDQRDAKTYSPFAAATSDDYLDVDITGLPGRIDRRKGDDAVPEAADAIRIITETDEHESLTASELRDATLTMYAFSFAVQDGYVGFIRNTSPRRRVMPGLRFLRYENALRRMEPPDIAIEDTIDIVVTPTRIAILSLSSFNTLFGDVGVAFEQVPSNIKALAGALGKSLPLSNDALSALQARCNRRVIDSKRLDYIVSQRSAALKALTSARLRSILKEQGLEKLIRAGKVELDDDSASVFLDALEGRLFNDDITGQGRRADAYSPR